MLLSKIIFLVFFTASVQALAMDCDLAKAINHPHLAENAEFWVRLGKISSRDDQAIKKLITEYAPGALGSVQAATKSTTLVSKSIIDTAHKAEKEIKKLSKINAEHYDEFLKIINEKGPQGFYERPGKWNYEPLPEYGLKAHSVRLDSGIRVLFDVEKNGAVTVKAVNNKIGH